GTRSRSPPSAGPRGGVPANPRAWLATTARNRAIDRIRSDRTLAAKTRLLDVPQRRPGSRSASRRLTSCQTGSVCSWRRGDPARSRARRAVPDEPEVHALLALLLINDAHREARFEQGTIVLLHDRD